MGWKYYVQFCKSAIFISGLAIAHKFVNYAVVSYLVIFITDNSDNRNIADAAALTNMGDAVSGFTRILLTAISTSFAFHRTVIFCSTSAYLTGLILLCLIAYNVIVIGVPFLIVAFALIQAGKAGSKPILDNFFREQLRFHETNGEEDYERQEARFKAWTLAAWLLALVPIILTANFEWQKTLVVSSSVLALSCAWFLCGSSLYHSVEPQIYPPAVAFRVLKAALLRINAQYPTSLDEFLHDSLEESCPEKFLFRIRANDRVYLLPDVRFCRWVDKAAIKESSTEEQQRKCKTVREVYETKHILRMVPIWVVFFGFGVARATWDTLFFVQADNYASNSRTLTITTLIVLNIVSEVSVSHLCDLTFGRMSDARKRYSFLKLRVWLGLLTSTACLIVAWKIEEAKPKRIWALVPQFCLSGLAEGLGMEGLAKLYDYQVPQAMRGHGDEFNGLVTGFGSLLAIICLFVSRSNWFGVSLESSLLYKYYIFITLLSITCLLVGSYVLLASYAYNTDMVDGHLKSETLITKDESENEARLHGQALEIVGVDLKIEADGSRENYFV